MTDQVAATTTEPAASPTTEAPLVTLGAEARDASFAALDAAIDTMLGAEKAAEAEPSKVEPAKVEPAKEVAAEPKKEEPAPTQDPTDLISRAIHLDRETRKRAKEIAKQAEEYKPAIERSKRIEAAVQAKDILAVLREVAPDKEPSAVVVDLLEQLSDGEKTMSPAQIKELVEKAAQEKYEAVQKTAAERAKAEADATYAAGVDSYMGQCVEAVRRAGDYVFLADPGRYKEDIIAYVTKVHRETGKVPAPSEVVDLLENDLIALAKTSKRLGLTPQAPAMSTTISASLASPSPQAGSQAPVKIDPYAMRARIEADRKRLDDELLAQFQR